MRGLRCVVSLGVLACGGKAAPDSGDAVAQQTPAQGPPVCSFITKEEAESIVGSPVASMGSVNPKFPWGDCRIRFAAPLSDSVDLDLFRGVPPKSTAAAFTLWMNDSTFGRLGGWTALQDFPIPAAEHEVASTIALTTGRVRLQVWALSMSVDLKLLRGLARVIAPRLR